MGVHFILKKHGESLEMFAKRLNLSRPTATKLVQEYDKGNDVSEEYKILFQEIEKRANDTDEEFEGFLSHISIPKKTGKLEDRVKCFIKMNQRGVPLSEEDLRFAKGLSSYITTTQSRINDENLPELFDELPAIKQTLFLAIPNGGYSVSDICNFSNTVARELSKLLPKGYNLKHFPLNITFAKLDDYIQTKGENFKEENRQPVEEKDQERIIEADGTADFRDEGKLADREPILPSEKDYGVGKGEERIVTLGICCRGGKEIVYHIAFAYQKKYCGCTVFEVALHEVFHWFQYELANAIINEGFKADIVEQELKAYKYKYNLDNYNQPWDNFYKYSSQLVEKDAQWFADYVYGVQETSKPNTEQKFNKRRATINEINKLKGQLLHREEIYEILEKNIPDFKRGSFQLTDYCYNRINQPIWQNILDGKKAVFLLELQPDGHHYKVLGENYPYSGEIYEKPRGSKLQVVKEFQWQNGKIISNKDGSIFFE